MPPFLLDANFFIEAHRKSYPMDVFPSFWEKVAAMATAGQIGSLDKVKKEIFEHEDALKIWCGQNLPNDFFFRIRRLRWLNMDKSLVGRIQN